jgi:hypothetical protein
MANQARTQIVLLMALLVTGTGTAEDYYLDSTDGSDGNTGTSPQLAWRTLEKVSSIVFEPGDTMFIKAGTRYRGQLKPQGSGNLVDGRPNAIVIDMYGEGGNPSVEAQGKYQAALYLYNVEYWEINNQGDQRQARRYAVYVYIDDFGRVASRETPATLTVYTGKSTNATGMHPGTCFENSHILTG